MALTAKEQLDLDALLTKMAKFFGFVETTFSDSVSAAIAGAGTVTSLVAGAGLSGGTITTTGTIALTTIGPGAVTSGGGVNYIYTLTTDINGRITALTTGNPLISTLTAVGTAQTAIATFSNTTAAANGAQQYSPALEFAGKGWGTTGSASQVVKYAIQNRPTQNPVADGDLVFWLSQNGGGYFEAGSIRHAPIGNNPLTTFASGPTCDAAMMANGSCGFTASALSGNVMTVQIDASAYYVWTPGAYYPAANVSYKLGQSNAQWLEVWGRSYYGTQHNISGSGAVVVDPTLGDVIQITASASISGITINTGTYDGQKITIILVQDAGGTSTWPTSFTNAKIAGGTFTKTPTASAIDTISYVYNSASTSWNETSRSLALA